MAIKTLLMSNTQKKEKYLNLMSLSKNSISFWIILTLYWNSFNERHWLSSFVFCSEKWLFSTETNFVSFTWIVLKEVFFLSSDWLFLVIQSLSSNLRYSLKFFTKSKVLYSQNLIKSIEYYWRQLIHSL